MLFREIVRRASENETSVKDETESTFAEFNMYTSMAHYVGKTLKIRPNEILDTWNVAELLVAYGEYANEVAHQNFDIWKSGERKTPAPAKYIVKFIGLKELQDG